MKPREAGVDPCWCGSLLVRIPAGADPCWCSRARDLSRLCGSSPVLLIPFLPALPISPSEASLQCWTEQGSRDGGSTHSCSGLKRDKYPEKGAAALAGEQGKLTEPPAAAEAIWGRGPPRTPLRVKPQVFPNNETQPQINSQQYAKKLLMFEITSLPTMKLSQFSTSICSVGWEPARTAQPVGWEQKPHLRILEMLIFHTTPSLHTSRIEKGTPEKFCCTQKSFPDLQQQMDLKIFYQ